MEAPLRGEAPLVALGAEELSRIAHKRPTGAEHRRVAAGHFHNESSCNGPSGLRSAVRRVRVDVRQRQRTPRRTFSNALRLSLLGWTQRDVSGEPRYRPSG